MHINQTSGTPQLQSEGIDDSEAWDFLLVRINHVVNDYVQGWEMVIATNEYSPCA